MLLSDRLVSEAAVAAVDVEAWLAPHVDGLSGLAALVTVFNAVAVVAGVFDDLVADVVQGDRAARAGKRLPLAASIGKTIHP